MLIKCLFITRRCDRDLSPELILAVDEYSNDANPEYYDEHKKKYMDSLGDDLDQYREIWVEISDMQLEQIFRPDVMPGKIEEVGHD